MPAPPRYRYIVFHIIASSNSFLSLYPEEWNSIKRDYSPGIFLEPLASLWMMQLGLAVDNCCVGALGLETEIMYSWEKICQKSQSLESDMLSDNFCTHCRQSARNMTVCRCSITIQIMCEISSTVGSRFTRGYVLEYLVVNRIVVKRVLFKCFKLR